MKTTRLPLLYAVIVSVGGFLFGFDAAVISGVLGQVTFEFQLDPWQQGLVVSAPTLAGIVASLTMGPLCDLVGRKKVLLLLAVLYTISALCSALAPTVAILIAARFIGGLAFGSLMIAPLYIAEITPTARRGAMVSINQLNIVIGFSAAYFSNYLLFSLAQSESTWVHDIGLDGMTWRWMLGIELLPAIIWLAMLPLVPESPRWLMVAGRTGEAAPILAKLFDSDEVDAIKRDIAQTETPSLGARLSILFSPSLRFAIGIGLIVGVAQQITGVNAIYFYAPVIFEQSGVGTDAAFVQATYVGVTNVVFTIIAITLIDRIGRRPLLVAGLLGVALSLFSVSVGFSDASYRLSREQLTQFPPDIAAKLEDVAGITFESDLEFKASLRDELNVDEFNAFEARLIQSAIEIDAALVLIGILGFVASFAVSLGPVMWVLFAEIFPNIIRGVAIAFVGLFNGATSFLVQLVFPTLLGSLGAATTFAGYAAMAVLFFLLIARYLPETRGQSLEQLETVMGTRR